MKEVLVERRKKSSPPPKRKPPVFIQKIEKVFEIRAARPLTRRERESIGLFSIWTVSFAMFFLAYGSQVNINEIVFYITFLVLAAVNIFLMGEKETEYITEDTQLNVSRAFPAFFLWGSVIFMFTLAVYIMAGAAFALPSSYEILRQCIVVIPSETFIFIVLLPPILDKGIGSKIPWVPGWILAQVIFGIMHFVSGALPITMAFFAGMMGILWYLMYSAGRMKDYGQYFGIASVMAFHFVWNIMAISISATVTGDPLIVIFKLLGL